MREVALVANSGPLIALSLLRHLDVLPKLYREITVPPAVVREVVGVKKMLPGAALLEEAPWLRVQTPKGPLPPVLPAFLGAGELEAICLALEKTGSVLMIDDYRARRAAEALRVTATGTAGVLVRAKREGLVAAVAPLLEQLQRNGYFISDKVIAAAKERAGE